MALFGSVKCYKTNKALSLDCETILLVMSYCHKLQSMRISAQAAETNPDTLSYRRRKPTQHDEDRDVCSKFLVSQTQNLSSEFKSVAKQQQTLIICAETV